MTEQQAVQRQQQQMGLLEADRECPVFKELPKKWQRSDEAAEDRSCWVYNRARRDDNSM